jgi:uncharacterized membrane protein
MEVVIAAVVLVLLVAPIVLAVMAIVRSHRTARENVALTGRVEVLERRIAWLRERLKDVLSAEPSATGTVPPLDLGSPEAPEVAPPGIAANMPPPPSATPTPGAAKPAAHAAPSPARRPRPPRSTLDLEALIGGRVLNRIGILAILIAMAFFLKWAFDNSLIGPRGRLTLGFLGGTALLVSSEWLLRRGMRYFSEGMTALGAGVLYLNLYAGRHFYDLIPDLPAFGGMIAVTLAFAILAIGRDSQRLAFLAFLGGYLTPVLLSTGQDAQVELFTYLLVLNGGLIVAALRRGWRTLEPLAFVWTVVYFAGWYDRFYDAERLEITCVFALLFFAEFLGAQVLRGRRVRRLEPEQVGLVLANASALLLALQLMLYRDHRWALTVMVLSLAAVHLLLARLIPAGGEGAPGRSVPRLLLAVIALTLVTLAIPIRLSGPWIAIAWAVEGALLVTAGFRAQEIVLRVFGLVVFVLVPYRLLLTPIDAGRALLNPRLGSFLLIAGCYLGTYLVSRRHRDVQVKQEDRVYGAVGIMANVILLWALSMEVWDFAGQLTAALDDALARQVGLSVLWTVYATCLLVPGVRRHSAPLRWQGLCLLGVAIVKVFVADLSFLEGGFRILSFVVLGAILLGVSFLYQRHRVGAADEADR